MSKRIEIHPTLLVIVDDLCRALESNDRSLDVTLQRVKVGFKRLSHGIKISICTSDCFFALSEDSDTSNPANLDKPSRLYVRSELKVPDETGRTGSGVILPRMSSKEENRKFAAGELQMLTG